MVSSTVLLFALLPSAITAASQQCYSVIRGQIYGSEVLVPCGSPDSTGFVQCCVDGDVCGADGFCHFTHSLEGGSGYYMGACTDPEYKAKSCPTTCTENQTQDVVYNSQTGLWACCYTSTDSTTPNCSNPGRTTFQAPSPQELFKQPWSVITQVSTPTTSASPPSNTQSQSPNTPPKSSPSSSSSSSNPSTNGSPSTSPNGSSNGSPSESPSISQSSSSDSSYSANSSVSNRASTSSSLSSFTTSINASPNTATGATPSGGTSAAAAAQNAVADQPSGLSTGAKAGIGVAVAVVVIALLVGAFFLLRRRRQQHQPQYVGRDRHSKVARHEMAGYNEPAVHPGHGPYQSPEKGYYGSGTVRSELPTATDTPISELDSSRIR